jgi:hypothetical protein
MNSAKSSELTCIALNNNLKRHTEGKRAGPKSFIRKNDRMKKPGNQDSDFQNLGLLLFLEFPYFFNVSVGHILHLLERILFLIL